MFQHHHEHRSSIPDRLALQQPTFTLAKIGRKNTKIIMACFGHCMVKLFLNNRLNGLIVFSASDWYNQIQISLFQTSKLDIFMIAGFPKPWIPVFIVFIIPKCFKNTRKIWGILEKYYLCKYGHQNIRNFPEVCVPVFLFF